MSGRTVLVTGGRNFSDEAMLFAALDAFHALERISLVIEGGQRTRCTKTKHVVGGADFLAKKWAEMRGVRVHTEHALWDEFGGGAGPRRNQKMVDMKPAIVIAFPGGSGTADCCRRAERARIPVSHVVDLG